MKMHYLKGIIMMVTMVLGLNCLGNIVKVKMNLEGVTKVVLKCEGNLYLKQGNENSMIVEVDNEFSSKLKSEVDADVLSLDIKRSWMGLKDNFKVLNYYITLKNIKSISNNSSGMLKIESNIVSKSIGINCTSSGNIETENQIDCNVVSINLSSSGDIYVDKINSKKLEVTSSGNGKIEIDSGLVEKQTLKLNSSGEYDAKGLKSTSAEVSNYSSGNAYINTEKINSQITSSGNVEVFNKATIANTQSSSSGRLIVHD
jgi:hypothetical protein